MAIDITGIGSTMDLAKTVINKIWPDKTEQEKQELANAFALVNGQLEINKAEASNTSVFVSGWRPFCGWVGGVALGYAAIGEPVLRFVCTVFLHYVGSFPGIDNSITLQVLFGMLGLGGLRTYEKLNNVASK